MPIINTQIDTTVDISLDVEIFCATCGKGLCNQSTAVKTRNRQADAIDVEACQHCLDAAEQIGYDKGYEAAEKEFKKEEA